MSAEYCSKCDNQFLTEADDYYVVPSECYRLICGICINKQLKQNQAKLDLAVEALEFYANEYSYSLDDYQGISGEMRSRCILYSDMEERNDYYRFSGKRAREVLAKLTKGE